MTVVEAPRLLTDDEEEYLRRIMWHLRDVPSHKRKELRRDVRTHLQDRPASDLGALVDALGTSEGYAKDLRAAHDLGLERTDWYARWLAIPRRRRFVGVITTTLAISLLTAGGITLHWWLTWQADFWSNVGGGSWTDHQFAEPLALPVVNAAGHTEISLPLEPGRTARIGFSVAAGRDFELLDVGFPAAPGLASVERIEMRSEQERTYRPFTPSPVDAYRIAIFNVHFKVIDCGPNDLHVGKGTGIGRPSTIRIRYRALGRERETEMPLPYTFMYRGTHASCQTAAGWDPTIVWASGKVTSDRP